MLLTLASCGGHEALDPEGWRARAQARYPALEQTLDQELDPAGFWELDWLPGYDHTTLQVLRREEGLWSLRFYRSWCMGRQFEEVHARSSEGVLLLDSPVWMFGGQPLQVLVPAQVGECECLVPDVFLGTLGIRSASPSPIDSSDEGWAYVRLEVADPDGFHERWEANTQELWSWLWGTTGLHPEPAEER